MCGDEGRQLFCLVLSVRLLPKKEASAVPALAEALGYDWIRGSNGWIVEQNEAGSEQGLHRRAGSSRSTEQHPQ
jgi:hypothetical protein